VRSDVLALARSVRTLIPKKGNLIHNNGAESSLLVLGGTIPISYQGNTYNIPMEIFITEGYPMTPPMCYVRPTASMALKIPHRHVDTEGLVYLPYLHTWNARSHSLTDLIAHIASVFGQDPPLFARPQQPPPQYRNATQARPSPPPYSAVSRVDPKEEALKKVTHKIQQRLQEFYSGLRTDIDKEFERQQQLADGQTKLESSSTFLSLQKDNLEKQINEATRRLGELDVWLAQKENQEEPDPNELIQPMNVWSQQLLESEAESQAIDDLLYYLEAGLRESRISVEAFLQETRKLSRKQFMCKALANKIKREQQILMR